MIRIFISYRRMDSRKDAGRIYDRLVEAFGKENIFKDIDSIPLGNDFRETLQQAVAQCDIQLAIIGKQWLDIKDENDQRRLDNPGDFVRVEIISALQRDSCLVVPVLVDNASMPAADDLPPDLQELAYKNAVSVRDDPDFHNDVSKIIRELRQFGGEHPVDATSLTVNTFDVHTAIRDFYRAFDEKEWEHARELLAEIRASNKAPRVFNVDTHEQEVWDAIEVEERDKEYDLLRLMAERPNKTHAWEALQIFWQNFPNYDPDAIADKVRPKPVTPAKTKSAAPKSPPATSRKKPTARQTPSAKQPVKDTSKTSEVSQPKAAPQQRKRGNNKPKGDKKWFAYETIADYTAAIQRGENRYSERARAYERESKYQEALADYTAAIQQAEADYTKTNELNKKLGLSGEAHNATKYLYENRARINEKLGDYPHALADYVKAMDPVYKNELHLMERGRLYILTGNYKAALDDYNEAYRIAPSYRTLTALGQAKLATGDVDGAIADLERALSFWPEYHEAIENLQRAKQRKAKSQS